MVFAGSSEAEKPVNDLISSGSLFHEVDTKTVYAFNEDADSGEEWVEQMTFGGGSSDGGSDDGGELPK
jgi:hypothetical protein